MMDADSKQELQDLATRLSAIRLERNWTQAQLAEEAGVSLATVRRLEHGHSIQLLNWVRILTALGFGAALAQLLPSPELDPVAKLEAERRWARGRRKRASGARGGIPARAPGGQGNTAWGWGEDA